jgi:hypothetical protein
MPGYLQYVYVKTAHNIYILVSFMPKAWLLYVHLYCYDGMLKGGYKVDS